MKHYKIYFMISLLVLSVDQLTASWRKPVVGAAAVAGSAALAGYYGSDDQSKSVPGQFSGRQDLYGTKAAPFTKTPINQDYAKFGTSGLREATTKLDKFVLDQLQEESIEGLSWSDLTSRAQRINYLKNRLSRDFILADDVNFALLAILLASDNDEFINMRCNEIKARIGLDKNTKIVGMDLINTMILEAEFREPIEALTARDTNNRLKYAENYLSTSYHEAGHALATALISQLENIYMLSRIPASRSHGRLISFDRYVSAREQYIEQQSSLSLDMILADAQNFIMIQLSGGIGAMIKDGKKVSFQEFLLLDGSARGYGIGNRQSKGTDIYQAYQMAEKYIKYKDFNKVSQYQDEPEIDEIQFQKEVDEFMEESYENAYQLLMNNKDKLDVMAYTLFEKGNLFSDEIYTIAGVAKPKFDAEYTIIEKMKHDIFNWLAWTSKKMKFYEEQHPQV